MSRDIQEVENSKFSDMTGIVGRLSSDLQLLVFSRQLRQTEEMLPGVQDDVLVDSTRGLYS